MANSLLIIFVKNPALGKVKTRLAAGIGEEKALAVYELLLEKTHAFSKELDTDIEVHYNQFIDETDLWENDRFHKKLQVPGDLGMKMLHAFEEAFNRNYKKVAIIGSDCYDLNQKLLEEAFQKLNTSDMVIGPSVDGGYYLLGMRKLISVLFQNKQWSSDTVFRDTKEEIEKAGLSLKLLPVISDVDVAADLGDWAEEILKS